MVWNYKVDYLYTVLIPFLPENTFLEEVAATTTGPGVIKFSWLVMVDILAEVAHMTKSLDHDQSDCVFPGVFSAYTLFLTVGTFHSYERTSICALNDLNLL